MSTRATYSFKDGVEAYHVYVHHDGCPTGALAKLQNTLASGLAWELPRIEMDEFAAAFIAANKTEGGSVRLTGGPERHGDIEYAYTISLRNSELMIAAHQRNWDADLMEQFHYGPLNEWRPED